MRTDKTLAGDVTIEFTIDEQGAVPIATYVTGDERLDIVAGCIAREFMKMPFPSRTGASTVSFPLVLKPAVLRKTGRWGSPFHP